MLALAGSRRALWILVALAVVVIAWRCVDIHYKLTAGLIALPWFRTDAGCDGLLWGCVAVLLMHRPKVAVAMTALAGRDEVCGITGDICGDHVRPAGNMGCDEIWSTIKGMLVPLLLIATVTHPARRRGDYWNSRHCDGSGGSHTACICGSSSFWRSGVARHRRWRGYSDFR